MIEEFAEGKHKLQNQQSAARASKAPKQTVCNFQFRGVWH
jgi:hypothetical protein